MPISCTTQHCDTYNQSQTYVPLYYAYAAYCNEPLINTWSCKWCSKASDNFKVENVISTDYLQAFIGVETNTNQIVLSFRGTHNYEDWFTDLEYNQIPYPNINNAYVHKGFYTAYNEIRQQGLILSLNKLLSHNTTNNILIVGHSLGGALAQLCALDLIENEIINNNNTIAIANITIYTFGCPRWANRNLAQYFDALINIQSNWRIVNKNDPVAIVPGKFLGTQGFYHTATEILYTDYWDDLRYTVCDGSGEDPRCAYNLWTGEKNAHLWYLNIHEDCGVGMYGQEPYHANQPRDSNQYGTNFKVNDTHWILSLVLICVGFITAIVYYIVVKMCQRWNGYKSIADVQQDELQRELCERNKKRRKYKCKKNIMKAGLLDS